MRRECHLTARGSSSAQARCMLPSWTTDDGAFMEQSGRNCRQPVANGTAAGQVEDRDAGAEREGRVSVAQVVGLAERLDPDGDLRWLPLAPRGSCAGRYSRLAARERAAGSPIVVDGRAPPARWPAAARPAGSAASSSSSAAHTRTRAARRRRPQRGRRPAARARTAPQGAARWRRQRRPSARRRDRAARRRPRSPPRTRMDASPETAASGCPRHAWPG